MARRSAPSKVASDISKGTIVPDKTVAYSGTKLSLTAARVSSLDGNSHLRQSVRDYEAGEADLISSQHREIEEACHGRSITLGAQPYFVFGWRLCPRRKKGKRRPPSLEWSPPLLTIYIARSRFRCPHPTRRGGGHVSARPVSSALYTPSSPPSTALHCDGLALLFFRRCVAPRVNFRPVE